MTSTDRPEQDENSTRYRSFYVTDRQGDEFLVIKDSSRLGAWLQSTYSVQVER